MTTSIDLNAPVAALPAEPESWSVLLFGLIVIAVIGALVAGVYVAGKRLYGAGRGRTLGLRFAAGYGLVLLLATAATASGAVGAAPIPRAMIFLAVSNLIAIAAGLSPLGGLVGFQAFRLPLELVLHSWAESGAIPGTMTWTGANFDVFAGALALIAAPLVGRIRPLARLFNVLAFASLANVLRVAVMSSAPFGWHPQPPLVVPCVFPYALIAPVCVAGALFGHLALTRRLFADAPA